MALKLALQHQLFNFAALLMFTSCIATGMDYDDCAKQMKEPSAQNWFLEHESLLESNETGSARIQKFLDAMLAEIIAVAEKYDALMETRVYEGVPSIYVQQSDALKAQANIDAEDRAIIISTGSLRATFLQAIDYAVGAHRGLSEEQVLREVRGTRMRPLDPRVAAALAVSKREYRKGVMWILGHELSHTWFDDEGKYDEKYADLFGIALVQNAVLDACGLPTLQEGILDRVINSRVTDVGHVPVPAKAAAVSNIGEVALGRSGVAVALDVYLKVGVREGKTRLPINQRIAFLSTLGDVITAEWYLAIESLLDVDSPIDIYVGPSSGCPCVREISMPLGYQ